MKPIVIAALAAILVASGLACAADTPTLTDHQKLEITTALQAREIAQLKAVNAQRELESAQRDFDAANQRLSDLGKSLAKPGYEIDVKTMSYQPQAKK